MFSQHLARIAIILMLPVLLFAQDDEPTVVQNVDLNRYVGLWYEIAKIPNRFQKACAKNTTAEYVLRKDGNIDVVNTCIKEDGSEMQAKGLAKVVDSTTNAKLKVSFVNLLGIRLFWGDYWVIGLEDEYQFAIVGNPSRKYGWILSRTPVMNPDHLAEAHAILKEQGYNPDDFETTIQDTR